MTKNIKRRTCYHPDCHESFPDHTDPESGNPVKKLGPFCIKHTWTLPSKIRLKMLFAPIDESDLMEALKHYDLI